MGCGKNNESSSRENMVRDVGCITEVVRTILKLQNQAVRHDDTCGTSCFIEPIGGLTRNGHADTRVFMLLDHLGRPFKVVAKTKDCTYTHTPFFRVEDIFGHSCATLRAIVAFEDDEPVEFFDECSSELVADAFEDIAKFKKTETCVTVDLNNFTAIQCVADVDLNIHHH
ncbi:MAG TPA: CotY/CotZ family spore coat protein [Ureibacillus sp.]|nr:CotY/CotZ family spore coat protein [Ureibacillus sp.]